VGSLQAGSDFELNQFLVRVTYMSITGVLLAFLASHQKQLQMESALVARILSRIARSPRWTRRWRRPVTSCCASFGARRRHCRPRDARQPGDALDAQRRRRGDAAYAVSPPKRTATCQGASAFVLRRRRRTGESSPPCEKEVSAPWRPRSRRCRRSDRARHDRVVRGDWFGRVFLYDPSRRINTSTASAARAVFDSRHRRSTPFF
jgi:hypothetical protein